MRGVGKPVRLSGVLMAALVRLNLARNRRAKKTRSLGPLRSIRCQRERRGEGTRQTKVVAVGTKLEGKNFMWRGPIKY